MLDYIAQSEHLAQILNKEIFFICGSLKSGTTWLQLILDGHPNIACRGEGHFTDILSSELISAINRYNKTIANKNSKIFSEIQGYPLLTQDNFLFLMRSAIAMQLANYGSDDNIKAIGEKTPANVLHLPLLKSVIPKAKFIHIIRDGRDVTVSGWFHGMRLTPKAMEKYNNMADFVEISAQVWNDAIQAGQSFANDCPGDYLEVKYEDLYKTPQQEVSRMLDFLDVDASPEIITGCCDAGSFEKFSGNRARGVEDRDSHFRKGSIGEWREYFDDAAEAAFDKHAGKTLRALGYN